MRSLPAPSWRTRSTSRCALRIEGTSGFVDQEDRVRGVERRHDARVDHVARVDDDVVVLRAEDAEQLLERAGVLRVRGDRTAPSRRGCRAPTCASTTSSFRNSLSRRCRFSIASSTREARTDAEEQRDLTEAGLEIHDDRRPLGQPRQLDARSSPQRWSCRRRPWRRETRGVTHGCRAPACAASRRAAVRRTAPWNDSSVARDAGLRADVPREELVGAGAHRLENQIRLGVAAIGEDRPSTRCSRAAARSPPCRTRHPPGCPRPRRRARPRPRRPPFDDADRHAAGAQHPRDLALELVVVTDYRSGSWAMVSVYFTSLIARMAQALRRGRAVPDPARSG